VTTEQAPRTRRDRLVELLLWLIFVALASYVAGVKGWL
jgi:hypothetical protein